MKTEPAISRPKKRMIVFSIMIGKNKVNPKQMQKVNAKIMIITIAIFSIFSFMIWSPFVLSCFVNLALKYCIDCAKLCVLEIVRISGG